MCLCVFMMVQNGANLEATSLMCVRVCLVVMVQYGSNLEVTALICVFVSFFVMDQYVANPRGHITSVCVCL